MEIDEYHAAVRRLGLRPSKVPNVYFTASMDDTYSVRNPTDLTPEQRAEFIEKLKGLMGITTEA
jgi:hypothetical protein